MCGKEIKIFSSLHVRLHQHKWTLVFFFGQTNVRFQSEIETNRHRQGATETGTAHKRDILH